MPTPKPKTIYYCPQHKENPAIFPPGTWKYKGRRICLDCLMEWCLGQWAVTERVVEEDKKDG